MLWVPRATAPPSVHQTISHQQSSAKASNGGGGARRSNNNKWLIEWNQLGPKSPLITRPAASWTKQTHLEVRGAAWGGPQNNIQQQPLKQINKPLRILCDWLRLHCSAQRGLWFYQSNIEDAICLSALMLLCEANSTQECDGGRHTVECWTFAARRAENYTNNLLWFVFAVPPRWSNRLSMSRYAHQSDLLATKKKRLTENKKLEKYCDVIGHLTRLAFPFGSVIKAQTIQ